MPSHPTTSQRFWSKVDKDGAIPEYAPHLGRCWNWTASMRRAGYGQFYTGTVDGAIKLKTAHRYCYELLVGPIPPELEPDHLCRNPACVRPSHLEMVTHRVNATRGVGPAARTRNTHCDRGHAFDSQNTYWRRNGTRSCRRCHTDREAQRARVRRERVS